MLHACAKPSPLPKIWLWHFEAVVPGEGPMQHQKLLCTTRRLHMQYNQSLQCLSWGIAVCESASSCKQHQRRSQSLRQSPVRWCPAGDCIWPDLTSLVKLIAISSMHQLTTSKWVQGVITTLGEISCNKAYLWSSTKHVGRNLSLPCPATPCCPMWKYAARSDDSYFSIGNAFKVSLAAMEAANNINATSNTSISCSDTILVPCQSGQSSCGDHLWTNSDKETLYICPDMNSYTKL